VWSPIHLAAALGHLDVLKYLINEVKANVSETGVIGEHPLHAAAERGQAGSVKLLIDAKAVVNASDLSKLSAE